MISSKTTFCVTKSAYYFTFSFICLKKKSKSITCRTIIIIFSKLEFSKAVFSNEINDIYVDYLHARYNYTSILLHAVNILQKSENVNTEN